MLAGQSANRWRRAADAVLDVLLPPQCLICGVAVEDDGTLCPSCWEATSFIAPPICSACGYPFEIDPGVEALCGSCLRARPAFDRARAVFRYDATSRKLLLGFKYADRLDMVPALATWMARAGERFLHDADIVVPVPLHPLRLFRRRFNQSALLARRIARHGDVRLAVDVLIRQRNTPSQGLLSPAARRRNVAGAFALRARRAECVAGRRVLLIDDVLTTGSTASECAKLLKRAGATGVDLLTTARAMRAQS